MGRRSWAVSIVCLALVAVAVAGCAQSPDEARRPVAIDQFDTSSLEVETGETTGGIRGVVVDEAIRPIAGATVVVAGSDLVATTDGGGLFGFSTLEPGAYFLQVNAPGFIEAQTVADVVASEVRDLRVLLLADPAGISYHDILKYDGYVELSVPLVSYILDIVLLSFLNQSLCSCIFVFDTGNDTSTIVFEMVWTPTNEDPTGDNNLYYQFYEHGRGDITIESEFHSSPILEHWDREAIWGNWTTFQAHYGGSALWVNVNQPFTSFVTLWHGAEAPEGWSFVAGDT